MDSSSESRSSIKKNDNNTAFLRASRDGDLPTVLSFLKDDTDINSTNANGLNALHLASKEGHINIVTELINRGINLEAVTKKGNTALHIASLAGQDEVVKILIQNGAKINALSQNGFTPLYMAAQENHDHVVRYLLQNAANPAIATQDGFTPMAVALQQNHEKVISALLDHDAKGNIKLPALHIAAKKNDTKSAAFILQNNSNDINVTTKSGFTPLHIAAHYGNVEVAEVLMHNGAAINCRAKNNITALHVASRWGKSNMVKFLLDHGSDTEVKTRDGLTPVHCAARSGFEDIVDILLSHGASNSSKTRSYLSPLHMAAQGDHADCARLLLYHKADINDITLDYLTPLHVASHCGNVKTAKLLLDRKCEPNARASNGFTPLHIACKKNRIPVIELLLKYGAIIDATTESGLTPLHVAALTGSKNIANYLIQQGADVNLATVRGETALHLAARAKQTDILRVLIKNGAAVDARSKEQQTPLHLACKVGHTEDVVLLLQNGSAPDAATQDLYTPLHIAAKEGHTEIVDILLENGASMNIITMRGFTPLHIAAKYGNSNVASILLKRGADPDVQGKNGLSPLHVAAHYGHPNVALLLLNHKASPHLTAKNGYTPLHIAVKKNQMEIAAMLIEHGANPNAESKNGFMPVHIAAQEGFSDMVTLLLENKADVNASSKNGLTPIHLAAQEDQVHVGEILIKFGSEIDPQTKAGYTPLHTACHFGQDSFVLFLLDNGASVATATKLGYTPLHQAAQEGQLQTVHVLLKYNASPNDLTNDNYTPLAIAERANNEAVADVLRNITEKSDVKPRSDEDTFKFVGPETMHEVEYEMEDEGVHQSMTSLLHDSSMWNDEKDIGDQKDKPTDVEIKEAEDDEIIMRAKEARGRQPLMSDIGATLEYPSYLEKDPDYEKEMKYFTGASLSPETQEFTFGSTSSSVQGRESLFMSGDDQAHDDNRLSSSLPSHDNLDEIFVPKKELIEVQTAAPTHASVPFEFFDLDASDHVTELANRNKPLQPVISNGHAPIEHYEKLKWKSFLVSFMVDARGGAMKSNRHSGVRVIIPPYKAPCPTRVTCRYVRRDNQSCTPPLKEGEGLAARVLEMGPSGASFLGPVLLEVPHFASVEQNGREIVILRSDNGTVWTEHPIVASEEKLKDMLGGLHEELGVLESKAGRRVCHIITNDIPQYFAVITRIHQDSCIIEPSGGVLTSSVSPKIRAVFPDGAVTKAIKVDIQAHTVSPDLVTKLLGNRFAASPVVTIEPRRRQFHKSVDVFLPIPQAAKKGLLKQSPSQSKTLRLLCSLAGGQQPSAWEDITKQTEITFSDDTIQFKTILSARFWLIDCQNVDDVTILATELYREAIAVPYLAKFVAFGKRQSQEVGQMRLFCAMNNRIEKTLERKERFTELGNLPEIEVLDGRPTYVEILGNVQPIGKSEDQLLLNFRAFRDTQLQCNLRVQDPGKNAVSHISLRREPIAALDKTTTSLGKFSITLPEFKQPDSVEVSVTDESDELIWRPPPCEEDIILKDPNSQAQFRLSEVAEAIQNDWVVLAQLLNVTITDINHIKRTLDSVNYQALAMLHFWVSGNPEKANASELEKALMEINRGDVIRKCIFFHEVSAINDEPVVRREPKAKPPVVASKRTLSQDEEDMIKESESADEESTSETGSEKRQSVIEVKDSEEIRYVSKTSTDTDKPIEDQDFKTFVDDIKLHYYEDDKVLSKGVAKSAGDDDIKEIIYHRDKKTVVEDLPKVDKSAALSDLALSLQSDIVEVSTQESVQGVLEDYGQSVSEQIINSFYETVSPNSSELKLNSEPGLSEATEDEIVDTERSVHVDDYFAKMKYLT